MHGVTRRGFGLPGLSAPTLARLYVLASDLAPEKPLDGPAVFLDPATAHRVRSEDYPACRADGRPLAWADAKDFSRRCAALEVAWLRLLPKLGDVLNTMHGMEHSPKFWEVYLGTWLQTFLHTLDARLRQFRALRGAYPGTELVVLAHGAPLRPTETYGEFCDAYSVDPALSSALAGRIATLLGLATEEFDRPCACCLPRYLFAPSAAGMEQAPSPEVVQPGQGPATCMPSCDPPEGAVLAFVPEDVQAMLSGLGSHAQVAFFLPGVVPLESKPVDRTLLLQIRPEGELETVAVALLPELLPVRAAEGLAAIVRRAESLTGFPNYLLWSLFYHDPHFLYAVALGRERGARILGWQHGGGYGSALNVATEWVERRVSDVYITWGWTEDGTHAGEALAHCRTVPLPQPGLCALLGSRSLGLGKALYGSSTSPPLTYTLLARPGSSGTIPGYFADRRAFLSALPPSIREGLCLRPYVWDYGWHEAERQELRIFPELEYSCQGTLREVLRSARLYLCDHMGTSMLESLVAGVPTLLFWDRDMVPERETARPCFDLLRQVDILHHDPVRAAQTLERVWNDVEGWWAAPERQRAVAAFCQRFALTGPDWPVPWVKFFDTLAGPVATARTQVANHA